MAPVNHLYKYNREIEGHHHSSPQIGQLKTKAGVIFDFDEQ